jgi:hypothetical protein
MSRRPVPVRHVSSPRRWTGAASGHQSGEQQLRGQRPALEDVDDQVGSGLSLPQHVLSDRGQYSTDVVLLNAGSLLIMAPTIIVFLVFQRQFSKAMLSGAVKG